MSRYLFTILPTNDLGLLTRSLPIARELRNRGHHVAFCHPASAPQALISQAGFENVLPHRPVYRLAAWNFSFGNIAHLLCSRYLARDSRLLLSSIRHMSRAMTAEVWNIDHFLHIAGFGHPPRVRSMVEAFIEIISTY